MKKIYIADKTFCHEVGPFAGSEDFVFDSAECSDLKGQPGVKHIRTPYRIDSIFAAGGKVVGVEFKMPSDAVSSHSSRLLARQLGTLLEVVDVPCLLLRDFNHRQIRSALNAMEGRNKRYRARNFWADLVRYQNSGITMLFGPANDEDMLSYLKGLRDVLGGGYSAGAFAGAEKKGGK